MMESQHNWEQRVAEVWVAAAGQSDADVVAAVTALVAERPANDPAALYEQASAFDFAGREVEAEPLYRQALAMELDGQEGRAR